MLFRSGINVDILRDAKNFGAVAGCGVSASLKLGGLCLKTLRPTHPVVARVGIHKVRVVLGAGSRRFVFPEILLRFVVTALRRVLGRRQDLTAGATMRLDAEVVVSGSGLSISRFQCRLRKDDARIDAGLLARLNGMGRQCVEEKFVLGTLRRRSNARRLVGSRSILRAAVGLVVASCNAAVLQGNQPCGKSFWCRHAGRDHGARGR